MSDRTCPFCSIDITAEQIRAHRPFGCPHCQNIINPRPYYAKFTVAGCLTIILSATLLFVVAGYDKLESIWFALLLTIPLIVLTLKTLSKVRPQPPRLVPYVRRTQSDLTRLADFLDAVAMAPSWSAEIREQFATLSEHTDLDDELERAATMAVKKFEKALMKEQASEFKDHAEQSVLATRRAEMHEIAHDLRVAEKGHPTLSAGRS